MPEGDVWLALLAFNVGVEAGQLLFVAAALTLGAVLSRLVRSPVMRFDDPASPVNVVLAYVIGSVAAYWTIERVWGFLI